MKKSRKVLAFTMAGCMMATAFAGCGGSGSSASDPKTDSSSKTDTSGVKSIYFCKLQT